MTSKSEFVFVASAFAFWTIPVSIILFHANTYSLMISLVLLIAANSLIISVIISSPFIPCLNCSFNLLSSYLYPHLSTFILRLPINFSAFLFCCLASVQYCNGKIVSFCWGLNFSLNISNNPTLILHLFCSSSFKVYTNLSPSLCNKFNNIQTLLLSCLL